MGKAVGLDAGEFEVKVVELDGSYRRPRLTKVAVEAMAEGSARAADESHAAREAEAVLLALEEGGFAKDNICMSFPCREAVLRVMSVPFVGEDQIRKVIKFEAESAIHSHSVDDMVVDFQTIEATGVDSRVLIAAVPKPPLRATLNALERSGLEPEVVDLDAMALFRTAEWCGAFAPAERDAEEEGEAVEKADLPAVVDSGPAVCAILDLGARSTRVLIVEEGKLIDMRALRTGADSLAEDIASSTEMGLYEAREAVWECLATGRDYSPSLDEDEREDDEEVAGNGNGNGSDLPAVAGGLQPVAFADVDAARERFTTRLRRELVRFMAGVPAASRIDAVWITGGASTDASVVGVLEEVFGMMPRQLDVLGNLGHKLSEEEEEELGPKLAVAVGLALQTLGGKRGFNFRQEDLAYTKGFDRVKFPLAVACMLALFLVLVFAVGKRNELKDLERQYGEVFSIEESTRRGRVIRVVRFNGYLASLVNPTNSWFITHFDERDYKKLIDKLLATPTFSRLSVLKREASTYFRNLQRESGYYPELRLGSGLGAIVELSNVVQDLESRLGRYLFVELKIDLPHQDQNRRMTFKVALRSDDKSSFREKGEALLEALRAACKNRQGAFLELHKETGEKSTFSSDSGDGYFLMVRLDLKPESAYPTFPTSAP